MVRQEALRRSKNTTGLHHKKSDEYICALRSEAFEITDQSDSNYIIQSEILMREVLVENQREVEEESERKK